MDVGLVVHWLCIDCAKGYQGCAMPGIVVYQSWFLEFLLVISSQSLSMEAPRKGCAKIDFGRVSGVGNVVMAGEAFRQIDRVKLCWLWFL